MNSDTLKERQYDESKSLKPERPVEAPERVSPFFYEHMVKVAELSGNKAVACISVDCAVSNKSHIAQVAAPSCASADADVTAVISVPHGSKSLRALMTEIRNLSLQSCACLSIEGEDINETCNRVVSSFVGDMLEVLMALRTHRRFLGTISPESIYCHQNYGFIVAPINSYKPNAMFTFFTLDQSYKTIYASQKLHNIANGKTNFVCNEKMGDMLARTDMYSIAVVALEMIYNYYYPQISDATGHNTFEKLIEHYSGNMAQIVDMCDEIHIDINDALSKALRSYLGF